MKAIHTETVPAIKARIARGVKLLNPDYAEAYHSAVAVYAAGLGRKPTALRRDELLHCYTLLVSCYRGQSAEAAENYIDHESSDFITRVKARAAKIAEAQKIAKETALRVGRAVRVVRPEEV